MYTAAALSDLHERTHRALAALMKHCEGFSEDELSRTLEGFGAGSIRLQLEHLIGAERYWLGVAQGQMLAENDAADSASLAALEAFRARVYDETRAYLEGASEDELNTPRMMTTWGGNEAELVPAHLVLRTQTHVFQHKGQIAAICRSLGRPVPDGLDFPLR